MWVQSCSVAVGIRSKTCRTSWMPLEITDTWARD